MSPTAPKTDTEREQAELLDLAFELYQEDQRALDQRDREAELASAAAEVGVPEAYVTRAGELLRERKLRAEARRRRVKRWSLGALAALAALGGAIWLLHEPAPEPFTDKLEAADGNWTLNVNEGTRASLGYTSSDHDYAAQIDVDRFAPGPDGKFHVNLDRSSGVPDLSRYTTAVVRARGRGLTTLRLYVESGAERWRSPAISLKPDFAEQRLPLELFEHQRREGGGWKTVGKGHPRGVAQLSFKLGHFMNNATDRGEVALDELRFE